ncbi:dTDP-4-dehydrorhamnose reductase family protein [Halobacteriovorax sp. YZS-1-1]|uniref:dTDP-4-dehydrorhamnose reductase family protein n=1 Tax=unclassified Halobacteriovorax TaxID=2639665 RepID=UPI00399BCBE6
MKILIIGANGMLGQSLYRHFSKKFETLGLARSKSWHPEVKTGFNIENTELIENQFKEFAPDLVLNCVGVIKQLKESSDNEISIFTNALWPHKLASICKKYNSKMIHFSTDCVFTGDDGNYTEESVPDSRDLYGLSKYLGEVSYDHTLTIRTSIIGHEIKSNVSLVDWFLSQESECKGFTKAMYSGYPTNSLARVIEKIILPKFMQGEVSGLYHVSTEPISKYDLLKKIASVYKKEINIIPYEDFKIDRSLNSDKFRAEFNYQPESWDYLVEEMHSLYKEMGR